MNIRFRTLLFLMTFCFLTGSILAQEKSAAKLYNEGLALLKEKNYEDGLPALEAALAKAEVDGNEEVIAVAKKNGAIAAYNLGSAKRKAGNLDEALTLFQRGMELRPEYAGNYTGVAMVTDAKGNKIEAVTAFLVASEKYTESKKEKNAGKMIKKASSIVGKLFTGKKYEDAVTAGNAFLAKMEDAEVNYYVSRCQTELSNYDKGLEHAEAAIALSGAEVKDKYYMAKGKALENLKRNSDAVSAYKMVSGEKYKKQADYKVQTLGSK